MSRLRWLSTLPRRTNKTREAPRFATDPRAVSDVIGSILLVGITVVMMTGLSIVVLSTPGPTEKLHAQINIEIAPGPDADWGTGDEEIRLSHKGGEPLPRDFTRIHFTVDGTASTLQRGDLDGPFEDGRLSIGETFVIQTTIDTGAQVAVDVIVRGVDDSIVASKNIKAQGTASDPETMHVHDISFSQSAGGAPSNRDVHFHVEIRDGDELALNGATVCLEMERHADAATETSCAQTDASGTATMSWEGAGVGQYTACVTQLTKSGHIWATDDDHASDDECHTGHSSGGA